MNFDLSRQSPFATFFFLAILIFVFWSGQLGTPPLPIPCVTPLEASLDAMVANNILITQILTAALVFVISLAITRITIRNVIFLERTYMPALIFLVISSGYYNSLFSFRPLLATLALTFSISAMARSYSRKSLASGDYVVSGFWFGCGIVLFFPAIMVLPILFIGLILFRFWDIREWVSAIAGLLMPIATSLMIYLLSGVDMQLLWSGIVSFSTTYSGGILSPIRGINLLQWTFIGIIVVLLILSVISFFIQRKNYSVKPYINYLFFIWFAIIVILGGTLLPLRTIYLLPIVALPLSVILPSFFNGRKATFLSNFLYAMFIITAIAISIFPLILMSLE